MARERTFTNLVTHDGAKHSTAVKTTGEKEIREKNEKGETVGKRTENFDYVQFNSLSDATSAYTEEVVLEYFNLALRDSFKLLPSAEEQMQKAAEQMAKVTGMGVDVVLAFIKSQKS